MATYTEQPFIQKLANVDWLLKLGYLFDIFEKLNDTTTSLQGPLCTLKIKCREEGQEELWMNAENYAVGNIYSVFVHRYILISK